MSFLVASNAQWEIVAIFGSLQNPDFILWGLGPKKLFFFGRNFCRFFMSQKVGSLPTVHCQRQQAMILYFSCRFDAPVENPKAPHFSCGMLEAKIS